MSYDLTVILVCSIFITIHFLIGYIGISKLVYCSHSLSILVRGVIVLIVIANYMFIATHIFLIIYYANSYYNRVSIAREMR